MSTRINFYYSALLPLGFGIFAFFELWRVFHVFHAPRFLAAFRRFPSRSTRVYLTHHFIFPSVLYSTSHTLLTLSLPFPAQIIRFVGGGNVAAWRLYTCHSMTPRHLILAVVTTFHSFLS